MASSWQGGAEESAPSTPERRGDLEDTGFIKHKVLKTDNLAGIAIKYRASVSDIRRLNALASDTAMFAREHVLVPTRPLAPPGEDRAQVALARLLVAGGLCCPPRGGRRRPGPGGVGGGFCAADGGGASMSMRSGASSRTGGGGQGGGGGGAVLPALHWGVGGGGGGIGGGIGGGGVGFDPCGDDGEGSGTPYSRRSDRTVSEPGDVELMAAPASAAAGAAAGAFGGAAAALAERVSRRLSTAAQQRAREAAAASSYPPVVLFGPSPSAPNLGAMFQQLGSAGTGAAASALGWFGGGGGGNGAPSGASASASAAAAVVSPLPPLARRSANFGGGVGVLRQLSTALGSTAIATVDALTRAASQPVLLRGGQGGGGGGGGAGSGGGGGGGGGGGRKRD